MSSYTSSPEAFGARLRTLREQAVPRLSGTALAARLGWAQSKVSRIETGKQLPTDEDVIAWCQAVDADDRTHAELVAQLRAVQAEYASLRRQLRDGMRAKQADFLDLEQHSATIRVFEPVIIPGLLQTAEYARHRLMESVTRFGADVADLPATVRERLRRQEILYDEGRQIQFLITEATLSYRLAPPPVMRGQLDRLLTLAGLDTIELRVIPFSATFATAPLHGFWIFDDALVQAETYMAELVLREPQQVQAYAAVFDDLWALGLHGQHATDLVATVATKLRE